MFINNISVNANDINLKKNQQKNNYVSDVTFRGGDNGNLPFNPRAAAAILALLSMSSTASGCATQAPQTTQSTLPTPPAETIPAETQGSAQEKLDQMGVIIDNQTPVSNKLQLNNVGFVSMPVSEFYFTKVLWPDFDKKELYKAIMNFYSRKRRFGGLIKGEE